MGIQNLYKRHKGSNKCKENKVRYESQQTLQKTQAAAKNFFAPRPPKVPPTVVAPSPIQATSISETSETSRNHVTPIAPPTPLHGVKRCPIAIGLLAEFRTKIQGLPPEVGKADDNHPLARFSGDPIGCVEDGIDAWEQFDGPLNTVLQTSTEGLRELVHIGEKGLIGLHRLLEYLVNYHGIQGALIEMKLQRLMQAMDDV